MPKKLPPEVVEHWPEIFGDIDVKVIPTNYLASVKILFHDTTEWEIDLTHESETKEKDIETMLADLFEEYSEEIKSINFTLDTEKVKRDVTKRTNRFIKKRK